MRFKFLLLLSSMLLMVITSCNTEPTEPDNKNGKLTIEFKHVINGEQIIFDSLMYENSSGNNYLINEIQYFISDVELVSENDEAIKLNTWKDILYIDTDIEYTWSHTFIEDIPPGKYTGIRFIFGIDEEKNQSLMFVNPPESFMFWPDFLGGGYHYMKLNGKWINNDNLLAPFNFHLGIGQIYHTYPDSITGYVHNYFEVNIAEQPINIDYNETKVIQLNMNIENWFSSPHNYDHNYWGGDIMQKQDAMQQAVENGHDVFSYSIIN